MPLTTLHSPFALQGDGLHGSTGRAITGGVLHKINGSPINGAGQEQIGL